MQPGLAWDQNLQSFHRVLSRHWECFTSQRSATPGQPLWTISYTPLAQEKLVLTISNCLLGFCSCCLFCFPGGCGGVCVEEGLFYFHIQFRLDWNSPCSPGWKSYLSLLSVNTPDSCFEIKFKFLNEFLGVKILKSRKQCPFSCFTSKEISGVMSVLNVYK